MLKELQKYGKKIRERVLKKMEERKTVEIGMVVSCTFVNSSPQFMFFQETILSQFVNYVDLHL